MTMGILVIDPNGIRHNAPQGPLFFRLDSLSIKPGQTGQSGTFAATINDNKNDSRPLDMTYLEPSTDYIRDNDEFWVGIQQGLPTDPIALPNTWSSGAGRRWIMGGRITERYYKYEEDTRITAVITGVDYTAEWRTLPFGTPQVPRDYSDLPTDVLNVASDLLNDVNQLMLPLLLPVTEDLEVDLSDLRYQYTPHDTYYPVGLSGVMWTKNFQEEDAFGVMQNVCEEINYDWTIIPDPDGLTPAQRRRVMLYPRSSFPDSSMRIAYELNVREVPEIQMGSTEDLITDILVTGTDQSTVPPNTSLWSSPTLWPDRDVASRRYSAFSFPPPPNPVLTGLSTANQEPDPSITESGLLVGFDKWSDYTQVLDDDGMPGINFRRAGLLGQFPDSTIANRTFRNFLSFWTGGTGFPTMTSMQLSLLSWRRLLFKFRHVTRPDRQNIQFGQTSTLTVDADFSTIVPTQTQEYYSDRNIFKVGNRLWAFYNKNTTYKDLYASSSTDGGVTWGGEVKLTPTLTRSTLNDSVWVFGNRFHYARTDVRTVGLGARLYYRSGILNGDGTVTFTADEVVLVTLYNQDSPLFYYDFSARGCRVIVDDYGNPAIFYIHEGWGYSVDQHYYSCMRSNRSDGIWNTSYTADGYRTTDIGAGAGYIRVACMGGADLYVIHSLGFSGAYIKSLEGYHIKLSSVSPVNALAVYTGGNYWYGCVAGRAGSAHILYGAGNEGTTLHHKEVTVGDVVIDHGTIAFGYAANNMITMTMDLYGNLYYFHTNINGNLRYAIRFNGAWMTGTIASGITYSSWLGAVPVITDADFLGTIRSASNTTLTFFTFTLPIPPISILGSPTDASIYKIRLHSNIDDSYDPSDWDKRAFVYEFGAGNQQSNGLGLDTVNTRGWHDINLLLPEVDVEGNIVNWNGWEPEYPTGESPPNTANPFSIDCVSLEIICGENVIDHTIHGRNWMVPSNATNYPDGTIPLLQDVAAGSYYLWIANPEHFFYRGEGRAIIAGVTERETLLYNPKPKVFLADSNMENGEWVEIDAINGEYPGSCTVRLVHKTNVAHTVNNVNPYLDAKLWIPADHSISLSQFHFERGIIDVNRRADLPANLRYPYRYKITSYTEAKTPEELIHLATQELSEIGVSIQRIQVVVDGDPRLLMGYLVQPQMDPGRENIFHNISMMIDGLEFVVDGTDFYCNLDLGTISSRARGYTVARQQATAIVKTRKLEAGKRTSMFGKWFVL